MPATAATRHAVGPERPGGQGLDHNQEESGNLAIAKLLTSDDGKAWTDFVATCRMGEDGVAVYEAWALRGMVAWIRRYDEGGFSYEIVETAGENPLARQDPRALSTLAEELAAGRNAESPFVEPEKLTYPYAYERLSQLFDSPNAPDLAVNPKSYAYGRQPGQHGALDVIQSRSPLVFSGPGVKRGQRVEGLPRQIDIAPTIAKLLGLPLIDGRDSTGRTSSERGHRARRLPSAAGRRAARRGAGRVGGGAGARLHPAARRAEHTASSCTASQRSPESIPNLRRLIEGGAMLRCGSITNFPSITWPSHNAIGTGVLGRTPRHREPHVLPARDDGRRCRRRGSSSTRRGSWGTTWRRSTRRFTACTGSGAERWAGAFMASVHEPCTRGADHASLERRLMGDRGELHHADEGDGGRHQPAVVQRARGARPQADGPDR